MIAKRFRETKETWGVAMSELKTCPLAVVLDALYLCERDIDFIAGCTLTDRPDLPLSPKTSWKMDFGPQKAAIAEARSAICALAAGRTGLECAGCSTCQLMEPASNPPKDAPGRVGSRSPGGCL